MLELIEGLSCWLQRCQTPLRQRVWIAIDSGHSARAVPLARLSLGSRGITVLPADFLIP